jgi:hypothetical protein
MSAITNVVKASKNTVSAAINTVGLGAQLLADGTELLNSSIGQLKPTSKAILSLPFSATKGYLVQEGMSEEQADAQAYRYIRQDLSRTVEAIGVGSGMLLSELLKEDDTDVSTGVTVEPTVSEPTKES